MEHFEPGDNLVFQLESGYGLVRVLAAETRPEGPIWRLALYEDLFPDIEAAEKALQSPGLLTLGFKQVALTERAFERTPAAKLGKSPLTDQERRLLEDEPDVKTRDRSLLQILGVR